MRVVAGIHAKGASLSLTIRPTNNRMLMTWRAAAKCHLGRMSQPVKISDELILDARLNAEIAERPIAGQIEFWAQLGRAIEALLEGSRALAPRRAGAAVPLSECLSSVDSAVGRRRVAEYLESGPFPHSSETDIGSRDLSRGGKRRPQLRTTSSSDQPFATSEPRRTSTCK